MKKPCTLLTTSTYLHVYMFIGEICFESIYLIEN
jgi:hypothetical protein